MGQRELPPGAWDCTTVGNHDRTRSATFFADGLHDEARARRALALVMLLPGTPVFYNGEEIGMRDLPPVSPEALRDGLALWAYETLQRRPDVDPQQAFAIAAPPNCSDSASVPGCRSNLKILPLGATQRAEEVKHRLEQTILFVQRFLRHRDFSRIQDARRSRHRRA